MVAYAYAAQYPNEVSKIALIPRVRVVIKNRGHWLKEEATAQVVPRLVEFLK